MDNYNNFEKNSEDYGWRQLAKPQYAENEHLPIEDESVITIEKKKKFSSSAILTFQLVLCIVFLITLYLSRAFMPSLFYAFKDIYNKEIGTSMFFSGNFQDLDFTHLFTATNDED